MLCHHLSSTCTYGYAISRAQPSPPYSVQVSIHIICESKSPVLGVKNPLSGNGTEIYEDARNRIGLDVRGEQNDTCAVGRVASAAQPLGQAERFAPFTFLPPVFVLYAGLGQA